MLKTFELLSYSFDIVAIALVITIVTMILLYCILLAIGKQFVKGIPFYAAGVMLFMMLIYQNILMVGAFQAGSLIDDFYDKAQSVIRTAQSGIGRVEDCQASIDEITSEFPLLVPFIDTANEEVANTQEWVETTTEGLRSSVRWFIFRRFIWAFVFILLSMTIAILFSKKSTNNRSANRSRTDVRREVTHAGRRTSHRRR